MRVLFGRLPSFVLILLIVANISAIDVGGDDIGNEFPIGITQPRTDQEFRTRYVNVKWKVNALLPQGSKLQVIIDNRLFSEVVAEMRSVMAFGLENGNHKVRIAAVTDYGESLGSSSEIEFRVKRATETFTERIQGLKPRLKKWQGSYDESIDVPVEMRNVTLITAALNIGRRHGFASFEDDYVANMQHILSLQWPTVAYVQTEYLEMLKPYVHPKVVLKEVTHDDLRKFKYYEEVQYLRTSPIWVGSSRYRDGEDGRAYPARIELYNPLVMSKPYWLMEVADENPFDTPYFLWVDCGMCARRIVPPLQMNLMRTWMESRFVIFGMDYGTTDGYDLHGFPHWAYRKLTGKPADVLLRGNILGGKIEIVRQVVQEYDDMLRVTLRGEEPLKDAADPLRGKAMGTEESVMTLAWLRKPGLFKVPNLSDNHLRLEMPCWMFGLLSAMQPTVTISYPQNDDHVPVENTTVALDIKNFLVPEDGTVCVTYGEEGHSVECAESTNIHLSSIYSGEQQIRAEIVSADGVPISVSEYVNIHVDLATSDSMDWDGPVLDNLHDFGSYLLNKDLTKKMLFVVMSDVDGVPKQLQWLMGPLNQQDGEGKHPIFSDISLVRLPKSCKDNEENDCVAKACPACEVFSLHQISNVECNSCFPSFFSEEFDSIFVVTAEPSGDSEISLKLLNILWKHLKVEGVLAGSHYYNAKEANHNIKDVVDVFGLDKGVNVQITQEMKDRSWLLIKKKT